MALTIIHIADSRVCVRPKGLMYCANFKLSSVISDLMGVSGQRMLRAMVAGEDAAESLSKLGSSKLRASQEALQESLHGQRTAHHRFMLEGLLDQVAFLDTQMARVDACLEEQMRPFEAQIRRRDWLYSSGHTETQAQTLTRFGP